jgi:hypothetical protein
LVDHRVNDEVLSQLSSPAFSSAPASE